MSVAVYVLAAIAVFWIGAPSMVLLGGSIFPLVASMLVGSKLAGVIGWSWWWVALPAFGVLGNRIGRASMRIRYLCGPPHRRAIEDLGAAIISIAGSAIAAMGAVGVWSLGELSVNPGHGYRMDDWGIGLGLLVFVWCPWIFRIFRRPE